MAQSAGGAAAARGASSSARSWRCRCRSSSGRACWRVPPTTSSGWISGLNVDNLLIARVDLRATIDDPARRDMMRGRCSSASARRPAFALRPSRSSGVHRRLLDPDDCVEGYAPPPGREPETTQDAVGPDYFTTLGTRLVQGRDIEESDTRAAPKVCVINEASRSGSSPAGTRSASTSRPSTTTSAPLSSSSAWPERALAVAARRGRAANVHRRKQQAAGRRQPDLPRALAIGRADCRGGPPGDRGRGRKRAAHLDSHGRRSASRR